MRIDVARHGIRAVVIVGASAAAWLGAEPPRAYADSPAAAPEKVSMVRFVPPPEFADRPSGGQGIKHPVAPAEGAYTLDVTVRGIHARSKRPWEQSFSAIAYGPKPPRAGLGTPGLAPRTHDPFSVTAEAGGNSPLAAAVVRGDKITSVVLTFRPSGGEPRGIAHTLVFSGVAILLLDHVRPPNKTTDLEEVTFDFRKIAWTWIEGGRAKRDDWTDPGGEPPHG